jgi:hypothetical protein
MASKLVGRFSNDPRRTILNNKKREKYKSPSEKIEIHFFVAVVP